MEDEISLDELKIEKLNQNHDLSSFDCGDDDLNDFIHNDCKKQMDERVNIAYMCQHRSKLVAFYTLSADSIPINEKDKLILGIGYGEFPALKIGRLAVVEEDQNKGIGSELLLRIVGCVFNLNRRIGVRFVSVDAYSNSVSFYERNNFIKLLEEEANCKKTDNVAMYFDPFRPI